MKWCLFWLIITFGFIIHPDYNAVPLVVDNDILTPIINDQFPDGTKAETIALLKEGETTYLVREGFDEKKNCRISRTELLPVEIGGFQTYMMRVQGTTETCTGDRCSNCGFKTGGGCECKVPLGFCNHSISKNWEMLSFLR